MLLVDDVIAAIDIESIAGDEFGRIMRQERAAMPTSSMLTSLRVGAFPCAFSNSEFELGNAGGRAGRERAG